MTGIRQHFWLRPFRSLHRPLLGLLGIWLTAASTALSADHTVHYYVLEDKASPFQITEAGDPRAGIVTDMVRALFEGSEYDLTERIMPLARLYKEVELDEERWVAYDAKVWDSLPSGDFVEPPLFSVTHSYLTCAPEISRIELAENLLGQRVAVIKDFDYPHLEPYADAGIFKFEPVAHYRNGIKMVAMNRADGFAEMDLRIRYHLSQMNELPDCLKLIDLTSIIPAFDISLKVSRNDPELKAFLERRIAELRDSGKLAAVLNQYQ